MFSYATGLGVCALLILLGALGVYFFIITSEKGYLVSDINFYEAPTADRVFNGLRLLEFVDFLTDVVTVSVIYDGLNSGFQVLAIISLMLSFTGNVAYYGYRYFKKTEKTYRNEAGRLAFGLFLAGAEDVVMIPLNIFYLLDTTNTNFDDADDGVDWN